MQNNTAPAADWHIICKVHSNWFFLKLTYTMAKTNFVQIIVGVVKFLRDLKWIHQIHMILSILSSSQWNIMWKMTINQTRKNSIKIQQSVRWLLFKHTILHIQDLEIIVPTKPWPLRWVHNLYILYQSHQIFSPSIVDLDVLGTQRCKWKLPLILGVHNSTV